MSGFAASQPQPYFHQEELCPLQRLVLCPGQVILEPCPFTYILYRQGWPREFQHWTILPTTLQKQRAPGRKPMCVLRGPQKPCQSPQLLLAPLLGQLHHRLQPFVISGLLQGTVRDFLYSNLSPKLPFTSTFPLCFLNSEHVGGKGNSVSPFTHLSINPVNTFKSFFLWETQNTLENPKQKQGLTN